MPAVPAQYPMPDRSQFKPNHVKSDENPEIDIGWDEGIFDDGRPYRAEAWALDGVTMLTVFFSSVGLEGASQAELVQYLEREDFLRLLSDKARAYIGVRPLEDSSGQPLWSVNIVIADDEQQQYASDGTSLKPHLVGAAEPPVGRAGEAETAALLRALVFAADKHRFQRRKGEEASPYINHPIAVAETLASSGITDQVVLQAALLHDTLEDTETRAQELEESFGPWVRDVVAEVTDDKLKPKKIRKELQQLKAPQLSARARLVRIADKISNLTDLTQFPPEGWTLQRRRAYVDWTEAVVAGCRGVNAALEARYDEALAQARLSLAGEEPAQPS